MHESWQVSHTPCDRDSAQGWGLEHSRTSDFLLKDTEFKTSHAGVGCSVWSLVWSLGTRGQTCFSVWKILDFSFSKAHLRWVQSTCLCTGDDCVLDSGFRSLFSPLPSHEVHHPHPGPAYHVCLSQIPVGWCSRTVLGMSPESPDVWGFHGVTLAEHQGPSKDAPPSAGQGREDRTKGFWIRIRAGRGRSETAIRGNTRAMEEIILNYCQSN